jgi:hypothetical protein
MPAVPALNSYFPLTRQPVLTLEYSREPPAGLLRSAALVVNSRRLITSLRTLDYPKIRLSTEAIKA